MKDSIRHMPQASKQESGRKEFLDDVEDLNLIESNVKSEGPERLKPNTSIKHSSFI
jgi:hypothetical protein